ncbi:hypothetical protein VZT92_004793 [Zoarces viviparus]|uniref:Uncharacterized protein n=1 Tax=Zoarces viviparus TaxID=48416 RepID=A0AAW1FQL6_ZOAVI
MFPTRGPETQKGISSLSRKSVASKATLRSSNRRTEVESGLQAVGLGAEEQRDGAKGGGALEDGHEEDQTDRTTLEDNQMGRAWGQEIRQEVGKGSQQHGWAL